MSQKILLTSTSFTLPAIHEKDFYFTANRVFGSYFKPEMLEEYDKSASGEALLMFHHFDDVGLSYRARIAQFAAVAGQFLGSPLELRLRENTFGTDRDEYFYLGPDAQELATFKVQCHAERAFQEMNQLRFDADPAVQAVLDALAALKSDSQNENPEEAPHP